MFWVVALTELTVNVTLVTERGVNDTVTPEPLFVSPPTATVDPSLKLNVPPST